MPRHSPYALFRLNFLLQFSSLELLEFLRKQDNYFRIKKVFLFSLPPFGEIVFCYPYYLERLNLLKIVSSLSVRFFNSFKSKYLNFFFFLFDCQVSLQTMYLSIPCLLSALPTGRSGWTRTIDLALIRRALQPPELQTDSHLALGSLPLLIVMHCRASSFLTPCVSSLSPHNCTFQLFSESMTLAIASKNGGDDGIRTHDPLLAGQVLSQLSYTPIIK